MNPEFVFLEFDFVCFSTIKGVSVAESVQKPMAPFKRNLDKTLSVISKKASRFPDNMAVSVVSGGLRREIDVSGRSLPCPQLPPINRYSVCVPTAICSEFVIFQF